MLDNREELTIEERNDLINQELDAWINLVKLQELAIKPYFSFNKYKNSIDILELLDIPDYYSKTLL